MSQLFGESNDDEDDVSDGIEDNGSDDYNNDNNIGDTVNKNPDHHSSNTGRVRGIEVNHINPNHPHNNPFPYPHLKSHMNSHLNQLGTISLHQQQQSVDHKKVKSDIIGHDGYLDDIDDDDDIRNTAAAAIAAAVAAVGEDDVDEEEHDGGEEEEDIINEITRNAKSNINSNINKTHPNLSESHQHFMNKNCHY